jgi:hypothetical protein
MKPSGSLRVLDRLKMLTRSVQTAVALSLLGIVSYLAIDWLRVTSPGRSLPRSVTSTLLSVLVGVYPIVVAVAVLGLVLAARAMHQTHFRGHTQPGRQKRRWAARCLLICGTFLVAIVLAEASAAAWLLWIHRLPGLPANFVAQGAPAGENSIVVIGESSALGVPFEDWLSLGAIVGRELERAIPSRRFGVDVLAEKGATLEAMQLKLAGLTRRPDALIVYSGHNEFLARYSFSSRVAYYDDDPLLRRQGGWIKTVGRLSPLLRLARENLEKHQGAISPARAYGAIETVVGRPVCTPSEAEAVVADFERRLEAIVLDCERIGCLPILIIPPGNDASDPSQSYARPETRANARRRSFHRLAEIRAGEEHNQAGAIAAYREILAEQPTHAQTQHRLARLLESVGEYATASRHYKLARDHDGLPMRCSTALETAYRAVARRHESHVILVDGPAVLSAKSRHGILDNDLFHDNVHPTLTGHVALAEAVLSGIKARAAFGWPASTPVPLLKTPTVATEFGIDAAAWGTVCKRTAEHYDRLASLLLDPAERLSWRDRYLQAAQAIATGTSPDNTGIPGLGTAESTLVPSRSSP